jgi:hypothetical protein
MRRVQATMPQISEPNIQAYLIIETSNKEKCAVSTQKISARRENKNVFRGPRKDLVTLNGKKKRLSIRRSACIVELDGMRYELETERKI